MSSIKKQFYAGLKAEFDSDDFTTSFLYRRLAAEKDAEVLQASPRMPMGDIPKRADPYVLLKTCWMALERREIREEDYLKTALRILIKNPKLRVEKRFRESLWSYGERLRGDGAFAGMRQNKQRYEALLRILEEGPPAMPFGERARRDLHEELLKCALEVDARTFLYDAGFPASAQEAGAAPRKKDRLLDMLDAYCEENRYFLQRRTFAGQGARGGQTLDEEQRGRIEAFYRMLRDGKDAAFSRVVIPVQIDPLSGAGLYIMGKNRFGSAPAIQKRIRGNCCYVCFYLGDIDIDEEVEAIMFSWIPGEKERGVDECLTDMCGFPSLDEALSWYQELFQQKAYGYFRELNSAPPPNCPRELSVYFRGGQVPGRCDDTPIYVSRDDMKKEKEKEAADFSKARKRSVRG